MTTTVVIYSLGLASVSGVAVAATEQLSSGQQWTVLAILGMVVLGIGGKLVLAIEANTKVLAAVDTSMQLLRQESVTARGEAEKARGDMRDQVRNLPEAVADELQRRKVG